MFTTDQLRELAIMADNLSESSLMFASALLVLPDSAEVELKRYDEWEALVVASVQF